MKKVLFLIICLIPLGSWHIILSQSEGKIQFNSSDPELTEAFNWAKEEALSYAHSNDPVGPWYEAALPGRDAFCMRDVSHQSLGAAMLGLSLQNKNMFHKFAQNISESKDYCSYWEINKINKPAPVDYENDKDFWYNLPANFDVIYNCYRQYMWTGDSTYLNHPDFINFYETSLTEYVDRWDLAYDKVTSRDRLVNIESPDSPSQSRFYSKRGIPTYNEGGKGETLLGLDMTASLIAAYQAYASILRLKGEEKMASNIEKRADLEKNFLEDFWWDELKEEYRSILYEDHSFDYFMVGDNQAFTHYLLYFKAIDNKDRIKSIMKNYIANHDKLIVELKSYLPILFYENGNSDIANELLISLCSENNKRRSYPENSYTVIESFVAGLMGVEVNASKHELSTISRINEEKKWAELSDLPVLSGSVTIRHKGNSKTSLSNSSTNIINWKANFKGRHNMLYINGIAFKSKQIKGGSASFIEIKILPGQTITVSI
ncbi:MAG: hypothetical protein QNK30_10560 [Bacteroidales bacterium]|nr:hypothetical protein [Bacteroidales bacterium]